MGFQLFIVPYWAEKHAHGKANEIAGPDDVLCAHDLDPQAIVLFRQ